MLQAPMFDGLSVDLLPFDLDGFLPRPGGVHRRSDLQARAGIAALGRCCANPVVDLVPTLLREALDMATWFCDAYASWQKGGIENANGRLRRWLPRQTNIDDLSDEGLQEIVMTYNLTPRKCLGYITPIQALFKYLGRDVRLRIA